MFPVSEVASLPDDCQWRRRPDEQIAMYDYLQRGGKRGFLLIQADSPWLGLPAAEAGYTIWTEA